MFRKQTLVSGVSPCPAALALGRIIVVRPFFAVVRLVFKGLFGVDSYITFDYETMSTISHDSGSTTDLPLANSLFDFPGADIILRSSDSYHLQVPKTYIFNSSPVLGKLIRAALDSSGNANPETLFPVVQLPESGKILRCLFTFNFPVDPLLPSIPEEIMELLSVAQKYQMGTALTHIRGSISQQNALLPTSKESAFRIYALAQEYGLRPEALRAARAIFLKHSISIEDLDGKLDIMPGASLYELWKYHETVEANLTSDLTEFRTSGAHGTIIGLRCTELSSSQIPSWLDRYIGSIEKSPSLFDLVEFNATMARHIANKAFNCECASIPSETVRDFWEALGSVFDGSFENVSVLDVRSCLGY